MSSDLEETRKKAVKINFGLKRFWRKFEYSIETKKFWIVHNISVNVIHSLKNYSRILSMFNIHRMSIFFDTNLYPCRICSTIFLRVYVRVESDNKNSLKSNSFSLFIKHIKIIPCYYIRITCFYVSFAFNFEIVNHFESCD